MPTTTTSPRTELNSNACIHAPSRTRLKQIARANVSHVSRQGSTAHRFGPGRLVPEPRPAPRERRIEKRIIALFSQPDRVRRDPLPPREAGGLRRIRRQPLHRESVHLRCLLEYNLEPAWKHAIGDETPQPRAANEGRGITEPRARRRGSGWHLILRRLSSRQGCETAKSARRFDCGLVARCLLPVDKSMNISPWR